MFSHKVNRDQWPELIEGAPPVHVKCTFGQITCFLNINVHLHILQKELFKIMSYIKSHINFGNLYQVLFFVQIPRFPFAAIYIILIILFSIYMYKDKKCHYYLLVDIICTNPFFSLMFTSIFILSYIMDKKHLCFCYFVYCLPSKIKIVLLSYCLTTN